MKHSKHFIFPKSRALKRTELLAVYHTLRKSLGHQHWWPGETPFEVMVGAILTQNTAWKNVEKAIGNLKKEKKLSPWALQDISVKHLASLIRPAGYFNVKADRLKHFIQFLFREYGGNLRRMCKEKGEILRHKLLAVKGIGPETADSILLYAVGKPFFVIDAYTKRIFARHRFHSREADYGSWQKIFMQTLPRRVPLYNDFHAQIVAVGKDYCKTVPLCHICPLKRFL